MKNISRLELTDSALETLKWFALILMTIDHTNKYLFNATLPFAYEMGRLCLPIFAVVLAYNLARSSTTQDVFTRTIKRLFIFGLVASLPFIALGGLINDWWPLNVLFTLMVITIAIQQISRKNYVASLLIVFFGGFFVEFWWPGIAVGIAAWWYFKKPSWISIGTLLFALYSLSLANLNDWALAAVPAMIVLSHISFNIPRIRWAFYAYYPLHLAVLLAIRYPMSKAGYLFF